MAQAIDLRVLELLAPDVFPIEIGHALTRAERQKRIPVGAAVALLTLVAPFELTEPLLRMPRQSVTSLEAAVLIAFAGWAVAIVTSRRLPEWRTPLTLPWIALLLAMFVASIASPVSRINALRNEMIALPDSLGTAALRKTTSQATAAWGDPATLRTVRWEFNVRVGRVG